MKKIALSLICASLGALIACSQGTNNENQNSEETTESEGFGGVGADPNSGTVVSDDTAASVAPDSISADSLDY